MSDMIDAFRDMKEMQRLERQYFGVRCPVCIKRLPKAQPKILLPGQVCRAHKPHYRDTRPAITADQFNAAMNKHGWSQEPASARAMKEG
jgi:hypothetical protein